MPRPSSLISATTVTTTTTMKTCYSAGVKLDAHLKSSHCSRLQIRFDVSWIQVGDAHKKARSCECPEFTKAETRVLQKREEKQPECHLF